MGRLGKHVRLVIEEKYVQGVREDVLWAKELRVGSDGVGAGLGVQALGADGPVGLFSRKRAGLKKQMGLGNVQ